MSQQVFGHRVIFVGLTYDGFNKISGRCIYLDAG